MYNFPDSPTPGQEYTPPVGGQTYIWQPPRWLVKGIPPAGGGGGGGIDEAPNDGVLYARQSFGWSDLPNITVDTTAPSSPAVDDIWIDTTPTVAGAAVVASYLGTVKNGALGSPGMLSTSLNIGSASATRQIIGVVSTLQPGGASGGNFAGVTATVAVSINTSAGGLATSILTAAVPSGSGSQTLTVSVPDYGQAIAHFYSVTGASLVDVESDGVVSPLAVTIDGVDGGVLIAGLTAGSDTVYTLVGFDNQHSDNTAAFFGCTAGYDAVTSTGPRTQTQTSGDSLAVISFAPLATVSEAILKTWNGVTWVYGGAIAQSDVTNLVSDLALKAPLASPIFTGNPTGPTPTAGDSDFSLATTGFVANAVAAIGVGGMSTAEYSYIATTTPPPSTGQLRGNNATQSAITAFYLSDTNAVGVDITNALKLVAAGVKILVQDKTNSANVQYYVTSGPTVDNGTYFTVPVTWTATGSGTPFTAGRVIFAAFGVGSNNMPEAPADGQVYGRRGSDTSWQSVTGATAQARNRIINGNFCISQENGDTAGTANQYYAADQWFTTKTHNTGTMTTKRVQSVTPNGSIDRYRVTVTTQDAALAAGEYLAITTNIEGSRIADFRWGSASAKQCILRFGLKAPSGTYSIAIQNSASNRSYVASFTVTAANTDTEWSFVVPGDTTGTWLTTNGIGMSIYICFSCGTTKQASAITTGWYATNSYGNSANTNGMLTAGNVYELYDVGLYIDPQNTGVAAVWTMPDPVTELAACQRYFYNGVPPLRGTGGGANTISRQAARHPVTMRGTPAIALIEALPIYNGATPDAIISFGSNFSTSTVLEFEGTSPSTYPAGDTVLVYQGAGGNMNVSARM